MTSSAFADMRAAAKPIFVAYQASDKQLLVAAQRSSNSSLSNPTGGSGDSLSGGAIAGIAVGSAAAGIFAALLFFFSLWFCLGFRFTRTRAGQITSESHHELAAKEAAMRTQLDSQPKSSPHWSATELASTARTPGATTAELDTSATHGRSELPGLRDSNH